MLPKPRVATPDQDLRTLFQLTRHFRDEELTQSERIEQLMPMLEPFLLSPLDEWDSESLARARHFAEEIAVFYVGHFHDLSQLPVTYYKREKWIRRHLDSQFSRLFKEIVRRSGIEYKAELITEEPIYHLLQKAREKNFPKAPKSKGRRPHLPTLKMRFHVELASKLDPESKRDDDRRVLLPFELR